MFIAIEGLDGCGKTSVTKLVAEKLNAVSIHLPEEEACYSRAFFDDGKNLFSSYHYYIACAYRLMDKLKDIKSRCIICDRFIYSTIAYSWPYQYSIPPKIETLFPGLIFPQKIFYLQTSENIRKERIIRRLSENGDISEGDLDSVRQRKAEGNYEQLQMIRIDTDNLTLQDVVEQILREVTK